MLYQYRAAVIIRGVTSAKHLRRNFLIKWVTAFICWIFSHKNSISYVFCTFSEHLLLRAPLDSCFCPYLRKICLNKPYWIMNLMMKTWCSFLWIVILIKSRKQSLAISATEIQFENFQQTMQGSEESLRHFQTFLIEPLCENNNS